MGPVLEVSALSGRLVRLEPLARRHAADLAIAAEEDRSTYRFTWVPRSSEIEEYLDSHFRAAIAANSFPSLRSASPMICRGMHVLLGPPSLARPIRTLRCGDRLHLARSFGTAHRDQH